MHALVVLDVHHANELLRGHSYIIYDVGPESSSTLRWCDF
jgi:hypothetical protein